MSLYLDDEEMRELRIRSCLWEKNGFPGGDEELFPVFRAMSKTKDVAIAWSCAGHKDQGRIYMLFGCTEAGFQMLLTGQVCSEAAANGLFVPRRSNSIPR